MKDQQSGLCGRSINSLRYMPPSVIPQQQAGEQGRDDWHGTAGLTPASAGAQGQEGFGLGVRGLVLKINRAGRSRDNAS